MLVGIMQDKSKTKIGSDSKMRLDCLLVFVPKLINFYKPIGEHMFTVLLPMGLLSVADFVHKKGYRTQILHLGLELINNKRFSLREYLTEINPKVVGLSLHWHYQCYDTIETARKIKEHNPDIFIVLGGLTASYFHEEILRDYGFIDCVVRGDGEVPFSKLMGELSAGEKNFSRVPNLSWREQKEVRINEIAYVAQDEDLDSHNFANFVLLKNHPLYIKMQDLRGGRWSKGITKKIFNKFGSPPYFPLLTHKGCFSNCSYCGGSKISQKITCGRNNISIRSVNKVVETIKDARGYGYKEVYISYLPFNNHLDYFKQLFGTIKKEHIGMDYFLECWALPGQEIIEAFSDIRQDGSKLYIGLSPETGSEKVRRLNKGFYHSNDELIKTLNIIKSCGIKVILYFSVGLPGENPEDINATLNFKQFLRQNFDNILSISTVNPVLEPASLMYIYPEAYGIVRTRKSFKDFILSSSDINRCGFLTPVLGYFRQDFYPPMSIGRLSREDYFRNYLQDIICRSSCRLSDFIISDFLKTDRGFLKHLSSLVSRYACSLISKFNNINRKMPENILSRADKLPD